MAEIVKQKDQVVENWIRPHTPGPLTEQELDQFFSEGYLIKHGVFSKEELQPSISDIELSVDDLANVLLAAGKIKDTFKGVGFYQRLIKLVEQFKDAAVLLHKKDTLPPAFGGLLAHPKMLAIAKQILGTEISAHPVWNIRPKVPQQEVSVVPWHQDAAYMSHDCWECLQLTAWIPLIDTTTKNGCMQVVPRAHRSGRVFTHTGCSGDTWYIEIPPEVMSEEMGEDYEKEIVTCEMPMGSVLLFNALLPHRSITNTSNDIRWSLDLRWNDSRDPTGFYNLKDSLPLCSGGEDLKVDWSTWGKIGRTELQTKVTCGQESSDELDTTISGPWMNTWKITHHNRHTANLKQ